MTRSKLLPIAMALLGAGLGVWYAIGRVEARRAEPTHPAPDATPSSESPRAIDLAPSKAAEVHDPRREIAPPSLENSVVSQAPPRFLEGVVLDTAGSPVPDAKVAVNMSLFTRAQVQAWMERSDLATLRLAGTRTDATGRFRVEFATNDERVTLSVLAARHLAAGQVVVVVDATDIVIVLTPSGSISGRLLIDDHLSFDLFQVKALEGGQVVRGSPYDKWDGSFRWGSLPLGTYRLDVHLDKRVVARVDDVKVGVLGAASEPSPLLIDLRGRSFRRALDVRDERQEPVPSFHVLWMPHGTEPDRYAPKPAADGHFEFISPHEDLDVHILAPGFATHRIEHVHTQEAVVLRRSFTVRFVLEDPSCLPPAPARLRAKLYPLYSEVTWRPLVGHFDETGVVTFVPPDTGAYILQFAVEDAIDGKTRSETIPGFTQRIALHERMKTPHPISLPPAAVRAARERLMDDD